MPSKRNAPEADAPKPAEKKNGKGKHAEKLDEPLSEEDVLEVPKTRKGRHAEKLEFSDEDVPELPKTKKGKQGETMNEPLLEEDLPEVPKTRKGKQAEKLDDPLPEEDLPEVPKTRKGKQARKLEDPMLEEDLPEAPKPRKGKQAEKLDNPLSEEDVPEVPVKKSKKGKESKQVKKPDEKVEAKAKPPSKKRGAAKQVEQPDEEIVEPVDKKLTKKQLEPEASKATDEVPAKKRRGAAKQAEKLDTKDVIEELPARRKRGAATKQLVEDEESEEDVSVKKKRGTKAAVKKTETKAAPLNKTETKWEKINFNSDKKNKEGKTHNLKITSWNVDGIRSWLNKDGLFIMNYNSPDIFCLQETRCSDDKLPEELNKIDNYHVYWCPSQKDGYAGVGIYSKIVPLEIIYGIGNDEHDDEGRCITCEYDGFYLVNVYVPNAGRGLKTLPKRLEWNELFKDFIKKLDEKKPVIICGDMNVAHNEIDLSNPKSNKKNAGFTQEERDGMTDFLKDAGFIDTFRELYPDEKDVYTFWSYMAKARAKNVGWRLDYFIVSERISEKVCDNIINKDVFGSDHCPITLFINI